LLVKKHWILLPVVVLLLLLLALVFRWDYGPTKHYENSVVKWKTDRWTGQVWVIAYAPAGILEKPVLSEQFVEQRKKQILESPGTKQQIQELEERLAVHEQIKSLHQNESSKYLNLVEQARKQQSLLYERKYGGGYSSGLKRFNPYESLFAMTGEYNRNEKYEAGIPENIINGRQAWIDAHRAQREIKQEIANLPKSIEDRAKSELNCWAWELRKIAMGIWAGLVVVSILAILFLINHRLRDKPD